MDRLLARWHGGALAGAAVGAVVGLGGSLMAQWWLLVSIPVGAFVGALIQAPIQPRRRIPRRTVVVAALLADILGAYCVAAAAVAIEPGVGSFVVGNGPLEDVLSFGTVGVLYGGIWMLFVTGPSAVAGAVLLRGLRGRDHGAGG